MEEFYVLFNSISVISEQCEGDDERLCAMEPVYSWKDFRLLRASNLRALDQEASS